MPDSFIQQQSNITTESPGILSYDSVVTNDETKLNFKAMSICSLQLMWFGFLLCLDCFLFVFTYLPVRLLLALLRFLGNIICFRFLKNR